MANGQIDLEPEEIDLFTALAQVFEAFPAMRGKFAIARVHHHFPIAVDEVLYETSDPVARVSVVRPMKTDDVPSAAFASQWLVSCDYSAPRPSHRCCGDGDRPVGISVVPIVKCCGEGPADS